MIAITNSSKSSVTVWIKYKPLSASLWPKEQEKDAFEEWEGMFYKTKNSAS